MSANTEQQPEQCVICYANAARVVLRPCNHGGFCAECALQFGSCPLCRASIESLVSPVVDPPPVATGKAITLYVFGDLTGEVTDPGAVAHNTRELINYVNSVAYGDNTLDRCTVRVIEYGDVSARPELLRRGIYALPALSITFEPQGVVILNVYGVPSIISFCVQHSLALQVYTESTHARFIQPFRLVRVPMPN
jgi:hypothetical protein